MPPLAKNKLTIRPRNQSDNMELNCDRRESDTPTCYYNPTLENIRYEIYTTHRSRIQTSCTIPYFPTNHKSSDGNSSLRCTTQITAQTKKPLSKEKIYILLIEAPVSRREANKRRKAATMPQTGISRRERGKVTAYEKKVT